MNIPRILFFDKYFPYAIGGAQLSSRFLLKNLNADLKLVSCEVNKAFCAGRYELHDFADVEKLVITEVPRLPYLEYWANRKRIMDFFKIQKADLLLAQELWAPMAINASDIPSIYFVRGEYNANTINNYFKGIKFWLKKIYLTAQLPFLTEYLLDNRKAIERSALVIANSNFIKNLIKKNLGRDAEVIYPCVDVSKLNKVELPPLERRKYVTLIGSEYIKGRKIVEMIAEKMSDHQFMVVGRNFRKRFRVKNVSYVPWAKDSLAIYKETKTIIIPSVWCEAFSRVAVEATALGIPCVGSKRGGLPEVLSEEFLIEDIWDIERWVEKILMVEKNREEYREMVRHRPMSFDGIVQVRKFKNLVKEKLGVVL